MFKKITIMVIASMMSFAAFAYQGHGFKIISEKETHSPGSRGGIVSHTESNATKTLDNPYASATAFNANGKVLEFIQLHGGHTTQFVNESDKIKRYTYKYILSSDNDYENFERTLDLDPKGYFSDISHTYLTVQRDNPGNYGINVSTVVSGGGDVKKEAKATLRVSR